MYIVLYYTLSPWLKCDSNLNNKVVSTTLQSGEYDMLIHQDSISVIYALKISKYYLVCRFVFKNTLVHRWSCMAMVSN